MSAARTAPKELLGLLARVVAALEHVGPAGELDQQELDALRDDADATRAELDQLFNRDPPRAPIVLTCDMVAGCTAPITHIDSKGYIYCAKHGADRKMSQRCRKLTPAELKRLQSGEQVTRY